MVEVAQVGIAAGKGVLRAVTCHQPHPFGPNRQHARLLAVHKRRRTAPGLAVARPEHPVAGPDLDGRSLVDSEVVGGVARGTKTPFPAVRVVRGPPSRRGFR